MEKEKDLEFYRARVQAALECAQRWIFNLDTIPPISRRNLQEQLARELLEALGANK